MGKGYHSKIIRSLKGRMKSALGDIRPIWDLEDLLGIPYWKVVKHISSQFIDDMELYNHGDWHIDHIMACSSFALSNLEEQRKCFHYTNLRPLWAKENLSKNRRMAKELESYKWTGKEWIFKWNEEDKRYLKLKKYKDNEKLINNTRCDGNNIIVKIMLKNKSIDISKISNSISAWNTEEKEYYEYYTDMLYMLNKSGLDNYVLTCCFSRFKYNSFSDFKYKIKSMTDLKSYEIFSKLMSKDDVIILSKLLTNSIISNNVRIYANKSSKRRVS